MARREKLKRWSVTWTWTGESFEVDALNRVLAKMQGAQRVYGSPVRFGEFTARLLKGVEPVLKLS